MTHIDFSIFWVGHRGNLVSKLDRALNQKFLQRRPLERLLVVLRLGPPQMQQERRAVLTVLRRPDDRSARTMKGDATEEDEAERCRVGAAHPGRTTRRRNRGGRGMDVSGKEGLGCGGAGAEER